MRTIVNLKTTAHAFALILSFALVLPGPAAAVTDEPVFSAVALETPRAQVKATLGEPDGNEDGCDIFMFAGAPQAMMGMLEYSGGLLVSRSVVMKPGVTTADAIVARMSKEGMAPISSEDGTTVFLEKDPRTGKAEYRLVISADAGSETGPIVTCLTVAKFKELETIDAAMGNVDGGLIPIESFDSVELGWDRSRVVSTIGNPGNVDESLEMYMISDSPEFMLGMIEYGAGRVEALGTMYKPGVKTCKDLLAEYKAHGLNPINVDGDRAIFLEKNEKTKMSEYIMFEPGNDPATVGPTIMRMTVEKFKAISQDPNK